MGLIHYQHKYEAAQCCLWKTRLDLEQLEALRGAQCNDIINYAFICFITASIFLDIKVRG